MNNYTPLLCITEKVCILFRYCLQGRCYKLIRCKSYTVWYVSEIISNFISVRYYLYTNIFLYIDLLPFSGSLPVYCCIPCTVVSLRWCIFCPYISKFAATTALHAHSIYSHVFSKLAAILEIHDVCCKIPMRNVLLVSLNGIQFNVHLLSPGDPFTSMV